jgi:hypothetical protein
LSFCVAAAAADVSSVAAAAAVAHFVMKGFLLWGQMLLLLLPQLTMVAPQVKISSGSFQAVAAAAAAHAGTIVAASQQKHSVYGIRFSTGHHLHLSLVEPLLLATQQVIVRGRLCRS